MSEDKPEAAIAERYLARLRAARPSGGPALGYVCSYVPEEIPLAAGLRPVRLGARPGVTGLADGVLQSFACAFARALLDGLLGGSAEGLAAVVFAYTCDSLRAVFEIWRNRAPSGSRVHFLNLPCRLTGPGVREYTASEFRRLAEALGHLPGARAVTPEGLAGASATLAAFDEVVGRLDDLRRRRPDLLPGSAFLAVSRGALSLDREEAVRLLDALAREIEEVAA
ncbi:MAG: 2-hydroxyacyl-CoA dehydratase family protein, partial [Firmicutes bacterium]|nr:2-hydroxyacyl-CoA dehydratase family protein [Bacillota bacterium]